MPIDALLRPLLATFMEEVDEIREAVSRDLLSLENDGPHEERAASYAAVARYLHSLKGTSATMGLDDLSLLAHEMENVLSPHVRSGARLPASVGDALMLGVDLLRARLQSHANEGETLGDVRASIESMQARASAAGPRDQDDRPQPDDEARRAGGGWRVSPRDIDELSREIERLRDLRFRIERRIDDLDRIEQGARGSPGFKQLRASLFDVRRGLVSDREETAAIVSSLEDCIKAICTLPVATITDPLERSARDLGLRTGKRMKLSVVGSEIALDRRRLEALKSPLQQLLRNAIDHGIEAPDERERAGKHAEGAIVMRFEARGNLLSIEVSDDGAGIDVERVREEALARGLLREPELARLTAEQTLQLVFRSGLSTRSEVSETSGRGVGLDVVRAEVAALRGQLAVHSTPGQGTRFLLTVPVELGSSHAFIVRVGDHQLAIPMFAIESVKRVEKRQLEVAGARVTIEHAGRRIVLSDLGALLGLREARRPGHGDPLLVLAPHGRPMALAVDAISAQVDLVTHPLPAELRDIPAYQGAATASSGELILVLRPDWLGESELFAPLEDVFRRALVVDDSLTARALHRTVLESAGFRVHTAAGAAQALEHLSRTRYEVAVCDIAMAGMDGLELCSALRENPDTRALPIVLVSARDDDEVRARALAAGASAFLTKRDCASGRLLATIEDVVQLATRVA